MEDIEREIDRLRQENSKLKNENHELSETVFKKSNEINCEKKIKLYEEIAGNKHMPNKANLNGSLDILSKVLEEKENIMNLRVPFPQFSMNKSAQWRQRWKPRYSASRRSAKVAAKW